MNLRKCRDNLTREERVALKEIKNQSGLIVGVQDKGSKFVVMGKSEYESKMKQQLENPIHYQTLDTDPSSSYTDAILQWSSKWLAAGQINSEIADWVVNSKAKPGKAFAMVKTHKAGNPLRLITSCKGTAIENLSQFTEFYLKPLAQQLPSFIKDTTHFLNKIEQLNQKGPFPQGTLLVSWDVVSMFPNIDNDLGLSAVTKALNSRSNQIPSTQCIVEAVKICLEHNNSQFENINYLQIHGTAMGPKNACSYADLAMGEIDEKVKSNSDIKPNLWWRFRDDIFDLWTLGQDKLLEFTEFINSIHSTIKFTLVYSEISLNVLDLTLTLFDGFIETDVYSKPTDNHIYLDPKSAHPGHCIKTIPYSVASRIRRNCSTIDSFKSRSTEYQNYLVNRGYDSSRVKEQFQYLESTPRETLLSTKPKHHKKVFPLVMDYNPRLPSIGNLIQKHLPLIQASEELSVLFPKHSIFPAFRRPKNLKEMVNSKSKSQNDVDNKNGCFKCNGRCDFCSNFMQQTDSFCSVKTGRKYCIKQSITCSSRNIIYLATCTRCSLQYVGSTTTEFKVRFRNHKSSMLTNKKTCEVAVHFNCGEHAVTDFEFIGIEKIYHSNSSRSLENVLLTREAFWSAQLCTLFPQGLNKRQEFNSKHRIKYN